MNRFDKNTEEYKFLKHFSRFMDMDRSRTRQHDIIDLHRYFHTFEVCYVSVDILIEKMLSLDIELGIVYDMKEQYSYWNKTCTINSIAGRLDNFIIEAFVYDIKELTDVAKTIRQWKTKIINSFAVNRQWLGVQAVRNHPALWSFYYSAPSPLSTTFTVLHSILKSLISDQVRMYCTSSLTTSSKSVMLERPDTCHKPVMPGFIERRAR